MSEKCVIFAKRYAVNSRAVGARPCERPSIGLRKAVFYSVKGRLLERKRPQIANCLMSRLLRARP